MKTFLVRPKVYYGSQSLDYLNELKVKKVFLVTDQLMANMGVADKIITRFKGTLCKVFSEIEPVPSLKAVKKGLEYFREEKPDLVLALGGGAPIDVAKAILFFSYELAVEGGGERDKKQPLFIVIPTTSGTGSEVTFYSVITDTKNNVKIPLNDERLLPDAVILDAQLTAAVPPSVTADTGMDALTHAIESYVSVEATELTAIFSEKAIKIVFTYLLRAYRFGEDLEAREKLQLASCMAGIAFSNASLGVNHSMAHAVGAKFQLSHGRSNAILLPYIIEYNGGLCDGTSQTSEAARKYTEISRMLGLPCSTVEEGVMSLSMAIRLLNKKFNIPLTFYGCNIEKDVYDESIPFIVEEALQDVCTAGNPKPVKEMDLVYLLKWAYTG